MIYSWQKSEWDSLLSRRDKLPHALLLRGKPGIGKHAFAYHIAHTLLCSQAINGQACQQCSCCTWFKEGNHPDFQWIRPDVDEDDKTGKAKMGKRGQISVAQIRQLADYLSLSHHQAAGVRIILISPADTLNSASANALLKILEEPPANTLFLLVTSQMHRLLPTIISRCQAIEMAPPSQTEAGAWLAAQGMNEAATALDYAGGSPLLALELQDQAETRSLITKQLLSGAHLDAALTAGKLLGLGMERALDTLQKWSYDLLSCQLTQRVRYHPQHASAMQSLCKSVNSALLLGLQKTLINMKQTAEHPLSNEMQLENALLQYTQIFR